MHSSARQPVSKGPDGLANDLSLPMPQPQQQPRQQQPEQDQCLQNPPSPSPPPPHAAAVPEEPPSAISAASPHLMHFPHCRLEITTISSPRDDASEPAGKMEQIALPGALVRTLLSRFEEGHARPAQLPRRQQTHAEPAALPTAAAAESSSEKTRRRPRSRRAEQQLTIQRHFDDADDWVFSRCLLADFTGFREDEAEILSAQGRLCCWASVVLQPRGDCEEDSSEEAGEGAWELGFVVQRVGVRDPGSGWCECF